MRGREILRLLIRSFITMIVVFSTVYAMANTLTPREKWILLPDGSISQIMPEIEVIGLEDEFCLAQNIFFEAGIDTMEGMYAVADVTLNRVEHSRYPNSICEVVYQSVMRESWTTKQYSDLSVADRIYEPVRNKCQFSWYCDGKSDIVPTNSANWEKAKEVAFNILYSKTERGITEGSTHYHATYVVPNWINDRGMNRIGRIGYHIFYRWD